GGGTGQRRGEAAGISRAVRVFKRCSEKGDVPPLWVSEGGLEPPCPLRALAPQASASAYSATRTLDAQYRSTHRLAYLSKPNALRRVAQATESSPRARAQGRRSQATRECNDRGVTQNQENQVTAQDEVAGICRDLIRI